MTLVDELLSRSTNAILPLGSSVDVETMPVPAWSRPVPLIVGPLLQAVLNALYLGRLMINPHGFAANPDFHTSGHRVTDTSQQYRDGNSQGQIMGAVTTPVSPNARCSGSPG